MWNFRKKIYNIFKNHKGNFDFEEILQEATLKKYNNHNNKLYLRINNFYIYLLLFFFISISSFFIYSAYDLQIKNFSDYDNKAKNNQFSSTPIFPMRGTISDRNEIVLVKNEKTGTSTEDYKRIYANLKGLGHLIGYTTPPQKDTKGIFWQENFKGVSGVEEYYDKLLAGVPGKEFFEINAHGLKEKSFTVDEAIAGKNINLTIDAEIQEKAYEELKKFINENNYKAGSALMMDIKTGEIVFITNYPEFESEKILYDKKYFKELQESKDNPFLNRSISGLYAPGSIVKPMFALAALEKKVITPTTSIFSNGQLVYTNSQTGEKTIYKDWRANGWTNVIEAIAVSSDVFFYEIGGGFLNQSGIGINTIDEYSQDFGIDKKTGIDIFGEKVGNIPTPDWKRKVFNDDWRIGDTYISSIGQFGFLMTPIEALVMTSLIANNGITTRPHVLLDDNFQELNKTKLNNYISKENFDLVKQGMRMAVTTGTAKSINVDFTEIAAKTGTAQTGKNKEFVNSWVIGFWPYKNPKYAFVIMTENGPADKAKSTTLIMQNILWWMWENKKEYFTNQ